MPAIQPFRGWRYDPGKVGYADVTMPPYDVVDDAFQEALYNRHDRNSVRLILGRESETDTPQDNRYTRAAAHLDAWRDEGLFLQDKPSVYLYEQEFAAEGKTFKRRGFFARVLLSEWTVAGIYPHEKTLAGPKVDRLHLMRAVRGNLGPVFGLLTDPEGGISRDLAGLGQYEPVATFRDHDNVTNRFWVVDEENALHTLVAGAAPQQIFIADGHHRYETALEYRNEVRRAIEAAGQTPPPLGELDSDYVLMFIVPDSDPGLVIWPTHRLVYGIADFSVQRLLAGCAGHFTVTEMTSIDKLKESMHYSKSPCYGLILPDKAYFLALHNPTAMLARAPEKSEAWRGLDVSILHLLILEDVLGIDEGRLLRKENILYSKNMDEAITMAQAGEKGVQAGFLMRATEMDQVRAVSRAGEVMPQKSTYFFPKALSGLVFHLFW